MANASSRKQRSRAPVTSGITDHATQRTLADKLASAEYELETVEQCTLTIYRDCMLTALNAVASMAQGGSLPFRVEPGYRASVLQGLNDAIAALAKATIEARPEVLMQRRSAVNAARDEVFQRFLGRAVSHG